LDGPPPHGYSHGRMILEQPATLGVAPGIALEAAVAVPAGATAGVVVCHPHPLYGGDMDNPLVLTVIDACRRAGMATLRFNFRGTGRSTGTHDGGQGEREDVRAALSDLGGRLGPAATAALAGYSFGAAVAVAVAAAGEPLAGLALIAPPLVVRAFPSGPLPRVRGPVLVVAGTLDEYCPVDALDRLRAQWPYADVRTINDTDHFFSGGLGALTEILDAWAAAIAAQQRA
jgi:uncharacterized protein